MSAWHNGNLRTMKANYRVQQEDVRVIRPLVLVREQLCANFARQAQLPVISDNCPACFAGAPSPGAVGSALLSCWRDWETGSCSCRQTVPVLVHAMAIQACWRTQEPPCPRHWLTRCVPPIF